MDGKTYRFPYLITRERKFTSNFGLPGALICLSTLEDTNELAKEEAGKDYVVLSVVAPTFNGEKSTADFKN